MPPPFPNRWKQSTFWKLPDQEVERAEEPLQDPFGPESQETYRNNKAPKETQTNPPFTTKRQTKKQRILWQHHNGQSIHQWRGQILAKEIFHNKNQDCTLWKTLRNFDFASRCRNIWQIMKLLIEEGPFWRTYKFFIQLVNQLIERLVNMIKRETWEGCIKFAILPHKWSIIVTWRKALLFAHSTTVMSYGDIKGSQGLIIISLRVITLF